MTNAELISLIVEKTGSSPTTVRRVLRGGNKEVWPGAAERARNIRAVAREAGFLANASASAVRKGRFDSVLLVLTKDPGRSHLPESVLHSLCAALEERGKRLTTGRCSDDELTDREALPSFLSSRFCDGAIVNYTHRYPERLEQLLRGCRMPFVWLNAPITDDCVRFDDFGAGHMAAERLIEAGHRSIAYLDLRHRPDEFPHYSSKSRIDGFLDAMKGAGIREPRIVRLGHLDGAGQIEALRGILQGEDAPTGVVAYDRAERVMLAAAKSGLEIPRDLSLVSFGEQGADACGIPLSLMAIPSAEAGRLAVSMLERKIANPARSIVEPPLKFISVPGATVAPVAHRKNRQKGQGRDST